MKKIESLLVIDDDEIFQFLTKKVIEETSLVNHIVSFPNGLKAIEFLKSVHNDSKKLPDIILLDLTMPVMDGWGFLEEYVELMPSLGKKITLYIVSSSIDPSDFERAKKINAVSDFVIKPVNREKFATLLKSQ